MPGYEPFLLCDFHVHTSWSDGRLSLREVVDLYGKTRRFDVIAITDHILMKRDMLARAGRLLSLGRREFSVTEDRFPAYLEEIAVEARRARKLYDLLVIPGAEITQNHIRSKMNSHIVALNIHEHISADQPAEDILHAIRRQGALSIACHPHHRTTRRMEISTCYLWDHRKKLADSGRRLGSREPRRPVLGDEPEALPVRGEQRLPQTEAPLLVEDAVAMREDVGGDCADAARQRRHRAHAVPQRFLGGVMSIGGQGSVRCDRGQRAGCRLTSDRHASRRTLGADRSRRRVSGSGNNSHRNSRSPTSWRRTRQSLPRDWMMRVWATPVSGWADT